MKTHIAADKHVLLKRIALHQLLHGGSNPNLGLFTGKIGVSLFLFHYASFCGNQLYEDFAGELIDDVYDDINIDTFWGFKKGLLGIGWGIEYLVQQKFVEGDTDNILSNIDQKIMERDLDRIKDYSFDTGLEGLAWYVLIRLVSPRETTQTPFDNVFLNKLGNVCKNIPKNISHSGIFLLSDYLSGKQISYPYSSIIQKITSYENTDYKPIHIISWNEGLKILLQ